jgi:hypothetical protein
MPGREEIFITDGIMSVKEGVVPRQLDVEPLSIFSLLVSMKTLIVPLGLRDARNCESISHCKNPIKTALINL